MGTGAGDDSACANVSSPLRVIRIRWYPKSESPHIHKPTHTHTHIHVHVHMHTETDTNMDTDTDTDTDTDANSQIYAHKYTDCKTAEEKQRVWSRQ